MSKIKNKSSKLWYVVIIILAIYFTQNLFFQSGGSLFSQGLILLVMVIGLYSFVATLPSILKAPRFLLWVAIFWLMLAVTYVVSPKLLYASALFAFISPMSQFKGATCFCLLLFTGYRIGKKQYLPAKQLCVTVVILLVTSVLSFLQEALFRTNSMTSEETTNNTAYTFLYILIFIPLIFRQYKKIALVAASVIFVFVLAGSKRGAIICMALMLLYAYYWYRRYFRLQIKTVLAIALLGIIAGSYAMHVYAENEYMQKRMEQTMEGNSSGRDAIYERLWNAWVDADPQTQMIGRGSAQTVTIAGNFAHNDWLEVLTDNGLLGAAIYLMIFASLYRYVSRNRVNRYVYLSIMLWLLYWLAKTLFSMGYTEIMGGVPMMLLGVMLANIKYRPRLNALTLADGSNAAPYK
ncbi:MAG: O-antigen ligase family protein [Muribaculum sp.]|nr:O-antigen ligase family protein [Muribaculaceae bacterium]MCM1081780.1 O-antigen ligase family protein [Muribaculum sp.]